MPVDSINVIGTTAFIVVGMDLFLLVVGFCLVVVGIAIHIGIPLVETMQNFPNPAPHYNEDYLPEIHPRVARFVKIGAGMFILGAIPVFLILLLTCVFSKR